MTTLHVLIGLTILATCTTIVVSGFAIYVFIRNRAYLKQLIEYHDGLTDIQATLKSMILEHHTLIEQLIIDNTQEIIRHVTYTNRWQKVMAKMIRISGTTPLEKATGSETLKEASELHEIGLDIAKVAFEDKQAIEDGAIPVTEEAKPETEQPK